MKILFMGTPDFAVTVLDGICRAGHTVVGAVSQPDKQKNRGMHIEPTPVKAYAAANNIAVYQPPTLKDGAILPLLEELQPDCIVVVAYGRILPKYVLEFPRFGCMNIHGSLLPKYRGAAPIQWSILNGDRETGVTAMYMSEGLDTGDMLLKHSLPIDAADTAETLYEKLAEIAAKTAVEALAQIENGTAVRTPQDDDASSYAPMLTKELGHIDWTWSAEKICNRVRGLYPWPCAYAYYAGKRFKITAAKLATGSGKCGEILENETALVVAAGNGAVEITELQFDGKRKMLAAESLKGNKMPVHTFLDEVSNRS